MSFIKTIVAKFVLSREHKNGLERIAEILHESKKVSSVTECDVMIKKVVALCDDLNSDEKNRKNYGGMLSLCCDVMDYLRDTKFHAERLYHKPKHNGWKTVTSFPDINDYVKLGSKI